MTPIFNQNDITGDKSVVIWVEVHVVNYFFGTNCAKDDRIKVLINIHVLNGIIGSVLSVPSVESPTSLIS